MKMVWINTEKKLNQRRKRSELKGKAMRRIIKSIKKYEEGKQQDKQRITKNEFKNILISRSASSEFQQQFICRSQEDLED